MKNQIFSKRNFSVFRKGIPLFLGVALFLGSGFWAQAAMVDDQAGLFSVQAKQQAEQVIDQIYRNTSPAKELDVITVSALPFGMDAQAEARQQFQKRRLNGILIYISINPHKIAVVVGEKTDDRFYQGEELRQRMLTRFKQKDYNGGLLAGVLFAQEQLTFLFPKNGRVGAVVPYRENENRNSTVFAMKKQSHFSFSWLIWAGLGVVGILLLIRWITRSSHSSASRSTMGGSSPFVGGTGYGSNGGGVGFTNGGGSDWVKPVVGGVAGAVAGNWLYDKFIRGDSHSHSDSGWSSDSSSGWTHSDSTSSSWSSNDEGQVGSSFGSSGSSDDWGSSSDSSSSDSSSSDSSGDW